MLKERTEFDRAFDDRSKMTVYLAGASRELERVEKYAGLLVSSGLVRISHPWWSAVKAHGVGNDHTLERDEQAFHALTDLEGVERADVIWCLWPEGYSAGCPLELGYALALKHSDPGRALGIVVSGAKSHACIFTALAHYRDADDDAALYEVLRHAAKYRARFEST